MGENRWRDLDDWPVPDALSQRWYLRGGGGAGEIESDGRLDLEPPGDEPADRYRYDPADPVPTSGGATCCVYPGFYPEIVPWGPWDQREVEGRPDVLVYSTALLEEPVTVVGPIRVRLYVSSSAPDTDFTAKLIDVFPDGRAINLADGILRMRYRDSFERPELMDPGEAYSIEIDLAAVANTFAAGHRVRLEIARVDLLQDLADARAELYRQRRAQHLVAVLRRVVAWIGLDTLAAEHALDRLEQVAEVLAWQTRSDDSVRPRELRGASEQEPQLELAPQGVIESLEPWAEHDDGR